MRQGRPAKFMGAAWTSDIVRALIVALVYAVNSWAVINAAQLSEGIAAIWSANAVLLFAVMDRTPREAVPFYVGAAGASVIANWAAGFSAQTIAMFTVANMFEVALCCWAMLRLRDASLPPHAPANFVRFIGIAVLASALSATIATTGFGADRKDAWLSWFLSDSLGLLIAVPSLIVMQEWLAKLPKTSWDLRTCLVQGAIYSLVFATTLVVFSVDHYSLLFVIAVPVLLAVFVAGRVGAVVSTAVVACVAIWATLDGMGPVSMATATAVDRMMLLQAFLACQLMISFPIASVLEDRKRLASLALSHEHQMRIEAEKARRHAELASRRLALAMARDELTGLATRARIIQKLDQLVTRQATDGGVFTVAIFDIDHFKLVNDRFGHIAGDEVLHAVGQIARDAMPRRFEIGRIGGEEFMLLLPGQTVETASGYAEQLRLAVMALSGQQSQCGVTISVGLAEAGAGDTVKTLMRAADLALYAAKSSGRNQLKWAA